MKKNSSTLPSWLELEDQEASSSTSQVLTTNISDLTRDECNIVIDEMSNELI